MSALAAASPTVVAAVVTAAAAVICALVSVIGTKLIHTTNEIKVNVNHRLDLALAEIATLREELGHAKASPPE